MDTDDLEELSQGGASPPVGKVLDLAEGLAATCNELVGQRDAAVAELERRTAWSNERIAERDEAIRQAAELFRIARSAMGSFPPLQAKAGAWLALPIVKAARGQ